MYKFKKPDIKINKKIVIIVFGIIILLVAAFVVFYIMKDNNKDNWTSGNYSQAETDDIELDSELYSEYDVQTEVDENEIYTADDSGILVKTEVEVPKVSGNEALNNSVNEWADEYEESADSFRAEMEAYGEEDLDYITPKNDAEFYGTEEPIYYYSGCKLLIPDEYSPFKTPRSDNKVLSLIYNIIEDTGGVHGTSRYECGNFDAVTGELLSLETIATDYGSFTDCVIDYIANELGQRSEELSLFDEYEYTIITEWDEKTTSWYMSDEGLVFIYDPYELASYAEGAIVVEVPYEVVSDYINADYIK